MSDQDALSEAEQAHRGAFLTRVNWKTAFRDPFRFESESVEPIKEMLLEAQAQGASDIFIQPDLPAVCMVEGRLFALTKRTLDYGEVETLLKEFANRDTAYTDIITGHPVNARYDLFDPVLLDRRGAKFRYPFRVNASPIQHNSDTSCQIVLRSIPKDPPTWQKVDITPELLRLLTPRDGIIYIVGVTGSGKTTTLAATLRYILENDTPIKGNIVTAEEPPEFDFSDIQSKHSIITQSQVPVHFKSFPDSNREAMRRKPAAIMVGELRDQESIATAVEASNTGHPVFGTAHATNVALTARRLISRFPSNERDQAIYDIVESTRLIIAQRLVPGVDGRRVAAREYLSFTEEVKEQLVDLDSMGKVSGVLRRLTETHGHSFRKEGLRLLEEGRITPEVARELEAA